MVVGADAFSSRRLVAVFPRSDSLSSSWVRQSNSLDDAEESPPFPEDIPRGGANLKQSPPPQPSLSQFRKFALPCLGLWVAQPLLSLVDTAFVGLSGDSSTSARQLAALGPATTFFDGATYLFAFLNVATTNLYSSARAQRGEQSDKAESVVRTASRVATRCGVGIMFFLLAFSRPLLAIYIGTSESEKKRKLDSTICTFSKLLFLYCTGREAASTPGLLDSAVDYVKIRSFSMPASLLGGVLQAACLGGQDSVTPLLAILYSTVVNVIGDFLLVKEFGMGLRGAAIATLFAQLVATAVLVGPARRRLLRDHSFGIIKKHPVTVDSVSGKAFLGFAAPVLTLILGKLAAFGFLTNSAAGVPGQPTPLASHQIILSLFFFASPFLEVISQTAQTFIPTYLAPVHDYVTKMKKKNSNYDEDTDQLVKPWKDAAFDVGTTLLRIGFVSGSIIASLAAMVPAFRGSLITSDKTLQAAVKPLAKYLWMGAFLTAPVAVSEGVLLARRELKFLALVYLVTTALLPSALLRIKLTGGTVEQVWACFAVFQLFRAVLFAGRIWSGSIAKHIGAVFGLSVAPRQAGRTN